MAAVVCLGEALIDFVADVAGVTLQECPGFRKAAGGAPANVAVGVARLGVSSAFVGKVGEDPFGRFLEQTLAEAGVDTAPMRFDPDVRTGLAFVSLMANGERDFTFFRHPSADMRLRQEELGPELLDGSAVFHFGSITLITEPSRAATLSGAMDARRKGCVVSMDPNLRLPLWSSPEAARQAIVDAIPLADMVKVSEEEAEFLTGCRDEAAARLLLHMGPRRVWITRGAEGSTGYAKGEAPVDLPGFEVPVVDTTGAGDGYVAGLLTWLVEQGGGIDLSEREMQEAARFANAVGALTCTRKGAIPALPTRDAVTRLLRRGGGGDGDEEGSA